MVSSSKASDSSSSRSKVRFCDHPSIALPLISIPISNPSLKPSLLLFTEARRWSGESEFNQSRIHHYSIEAPNSYLQIDLNQGESLNCTSPLNIFNWLMLSWCSCRRNLNGTGRIWRFIQPTSSICRWRGRRRWRKGMRMLYRLRWGTLSAWLMDGRAPERLERRVLMVRRRCRRWVHWCLWAMEGRALLDL